MAPKLLPFLTTIFMINFAQRHIIEAHPFTTLIPELLTYASITARHTGIAHINLENPQETRTVVYIWMEESVRPWGMDLQPQCAKCLCLRSWGEVKQRGEDREVVCKGTIERVEEDGRHIVGPCQHRVVFNRPPGLKVMGKTGWMEIEWDTSP